MRQSLLGGKRIFALLAFSVPFMAFSDFMGVRLERFSGYADIF
jgi:hypothetical protein